MRIEVDYEPLEFFKYDNSILYMLDTYKENLVVQPLGDYKIPYVKIQGLHLGVNGILVGYIINVPRHYKLLRSSLLVGRDLTDAVLHSGILGLQVFESNQGVALISTKITPFFTKIDKPM